MANDIPCIDDRRGLIFTINRDSSPVYQVESGTWAHADNRWRADELPPEIVSKFAQLAESGKPGAFVRFLQGEVGAYVIYEKNIRNLPDPADDELVLSATSQPGSNREIAPYDIIICAKGGPVHTGDGEPRATQAGDYYVIGCRSWIRTTVEDAQRPHFVETTKDVLLLLEDLHKKNYLSMTPHTDEMLPLDLPRSVAAIDAINCYVLNLSSFQR